MFINLCIFYACFVGNWYFANMETNHLELGTIYLSGVL